MLMHIEPRGSLVNELALPGESWRDGVFPAHPSYCLLAKNRWLLLLATRGIRCQDDDLSIAYQVRKDHPAGPVLREGFIAKQLTDRDPASPTYGQVTLMRHPMALGVPRGALVRGKPAANANVFLLMWSTQQAGQLDASTGTYRHSAAASDNHRIWQRHAALNDAGDDLVFLDEPRILCQQGYGGKGPAFCAMEQAHTVIQSLVPPVPLDDACQSWAAMQHFNTGIAALRWDFDPAQRRYVWTQTGPAIAPVAGFDLTEGQLARGRDGWLVAVRARKQNAAGPDWSGCTSRDRGDTGWLHTQDLFAPLPALTIVRDPNREAPLTLYRCADGRLRMFSGDLTNSPYQARRDPLYVWDVDEHSFAVSGRQVVFDTHAQGIFPGCDAQRSVCFGALSPHVGGLSQTLAVRVMVHRFRAGVTPNEPAITEAELRSCGVYHVELTYDAVEPARWTFAER